MSALISLVGILLAFSAPAMASNRTVCFEMTFIDARTDCATLLDAGARRACWIEPRNPVGLLFEVWDKDTETSDDYIGTYRITGEGEQCLTFDWNGGGETNPDVYLVSLNQVRAVTGGAMVEAYHAGAEAWANLTWRNSVWYDDCTGAGHCDLDDMVFATDPDTDVGHMIQALDSAQRPLVAFAGAINDSGTTIKLHLPKGPDDPECPEYPTKDCCSANTACAIVPDDFYVYPSHADKGDTPPHEIGHILQAREFNSTDDLQNDCGYNGSGHTMTGVEYDSCATSEGWADYVAMVSWWDPNNTASRPVKGGFDIEEPNPYGTSCSDASSMELQVVKGFWDLDDNNNENDAGEASGDDNSSSSTVNLLNYWDDFAAGEANREDFENSVDGVNVYDYEYNASLNATQSEAFIDHNCLGDQTP